MNTKKGTGFAIGELLAVVLVVALLLAAALPVIGKVRGDSGVQQSIDNLVTLGVAHVLYAADWNGRQITWVVDDLAVYGSVASYNQAQGGCDSPGDPSDPTCHPPILAGWGCNGYLYGYWMFNSGHHWAVEPINFGGALSGFGNFRLPTARGLHEYVGGRWYDPTFFAPNDTIPYEVAEPLFARPCEWPTDANPPYWSSYSLSPAAMFHPDVMRSNSAGGWQDPWDLDHGFQSPGLFQAQYPDLKTHMIEHHWAQSPPAECNPAFGDNGTYDGCEPYYFNHGIDSTPVTLFYDGSVRLLANTEVFAADQEILKQTGGVDGLWHRGTPFGEDGYFISLGYDGVPLSHHILTTDGILGRDTLADAPPPLIPHRPGHAARTGSRPLPSAIGRDIAHRLMLTPDEGNHP
ncbi:MAG: hypothetical protein ACYS0G_12905 [Planctomycetota bacterium]|jgi:hypothetical protein